MTNHIKMIDNAPHYYVLVEDNYGDIWSFVPTPRPGASAKLALGANFVANKNGVVACAHAWPKSDLKKLIKALDKKRYRDFWADTLEPDQDIDEEPVLPLRHTVRVVEVQKTLTIFAVPLKSFKPFKIYKANEFDFGPDMSRD